MIAIFAVGYCVLVEQTHSLRQTDIHPLLKQLMSHHITHFRSVQWKTLLQAANHTKNNLPMLSKYIMDGLTASAMRIFCKSVDRHGPVLDITDIFAWDLSQILALGVEQLLATEPPTMQQHFSSGNS